MYMYVCVNPQIKCCFVRENLWRGKYLKVFKQVFFLYAVICKYS